MESKTFPELKETRLEPSSGGHNHQLCSLTTHLSQNFGNHHEGRKSISQELGPVLLECIGRLGFWIRAPTGKPIQLPVETRRKEVYR
ncbi:hypothetical protein NDU88_002408 [Pleurodeles waltl]|uniref:Uncharacterized protein n=1 Tax=Pleurodeles waltl TaxID=8319 RepID=A0AAV7UYK6_PLEWA|nr:hypothetical protein NDU88_002408 [Pleurodeles waltl]